MCVRFIVGFGFLIVRVGLVIVVVLIVVIVVVLGICIVIFWFFSSYLISSLYLYVCCKF